MKILVLNSGSSSIKYRLFRVEDWSVLAGGIVGRIGEPQGEFRFEWTDERGCARLFEAADPIPSHQEGLDRLLQALRGQGLIAELTEIAAIGHRVVHGGGHFSAPALIDESVIAAIESCIPLAPLHNPGHLAGIAAARAAFPGVPQVAVFDTAFHQTMPPESFRYAIPEWLYTEHGIRRYGFHGTSHQYVAQRAAILLGKPLTGCNLITLHLGNGAGAAAIQQGRCLDTSMGLTPLEGLVMGTRGGDLDPGVILYLARHLRFDPEAIDQLLNRQSGLLGLCGANDMREVIARAKSGDGRAALALGVFCHRLKKYIGAYVAVLGQVDALVFTGGIGEHAAEVRACACKGLEHLGIRLDEGLNAAPQQGERCLSAEGSDIAVLVIPTNEELAIAQQSWQLVSGASVGGSEAGV